MTTPGQALLPLGVYLQLRGAPTRAPPPLHTVLLIGPRMKTALLLCLHGPASELTSQMRSSAIKVALDVAGQALLRDCGWASWRPHVDGEAAWRVLA